MKREDKIIAPEDYLEPSCPLCGEPYGVTPALKAVPQQRIIQKMDEYMSRRDYAGAERHLLYWLEEAKLGRDLRGELMIRNELVGHYRKIGEKDKSLENAGEALRLLKTLDFEETLSAGTTYVNAATACNAFGENVRAMELFEKARKIYEGQAAENGKAPHDGQVPENGSQNTYIGSRPELLGGLYNNMALTCAAMKDYKKAHALYDRAMEVMEKAPNGELEQAITCLNRANAVEDELGPEAGEERINALLEEAEKLLDTPSVPRNGYYAFVCEKCAPTFSYYGYFLTAGKLKETAEEIYGRIEGGEANERRASGEANGRTESGEAG
ncbi:MAG: tetratricopeptide repeat protein [Clostridium sp.]|nr:tetratricopeptide repeat protein [Clostridium sp.]